MAERGERGRFLPGNKHEWKKGKSGNPGGRRGSRDLFRYVRSKTRDGEDLIDWLLQLMWAQGEFEDAPVRERVKANLELLQRGFGSAPVTVEFDAGDGENVIRFSMDIGPAGQGDKKSDDDEAGDDGGD